MSTIPFQISIHESGHCIVAMLMGAEVHSVAIFAANNRFVGQCSAVYSWRDWKTKSHVAVAGGVAESIYFGEQQKGFNFRSCKQRMSGVDLDTLQFFTGDVFAATLTVWQVLTIPQVWAVVYSLAVALHQRRNIYANDLQAFSNSAFRYFDQANQFLKAL